MEGEGESVRTCRGAALAGRCLEGTTGMGGARGRQGGALAWQRGSCGAAGLRGKRGWVDAQLEQVGRVK